MSEPSIPPPSAPPELPPPVASETPGELPNVTWSPGQTIVGLVTLVVVTFIGSLLIVPFDPDLESVGAVLALQAMLGAALIGVAFLIPKPGSLTPPALLGWRRPAIPPWAPAAITLAAYIGCAFLLYALIQPEQEDVTRELHYGENVAIDVLVGFLIIGVAPLTEELFFRGFMFAGLRGKLPFAAAALISAGIWGLFHFTGVDSWGVVFQLAIFGILLCWLYERTGSIWPCIGVHAINNVIAFIALVS